MKPTRSHESGQASVELVGLLPLVVLVALVVVQAAIAGFCLRATESAARAGARAASRCNSGVAAAEGHAPGWLQDNMQATANGAGDGVRVEVRTTIPVLASSFTLPGVVVRSATYPITETC